MNAKPLIFVSYALEDESVVQEICKELSLKGFTPMTKWEFPGGDAQRTAPPSTEADFFLICLSNNAVDSKGKLEASMQRGLSRLWKRIHSSTYLIPIRLEDCEVPESLKAFEPIDLFAEDGRARLVEAITEVTRRRSDLKEAFAPISAEPEPSLLPEESLEGPLDPNSTFDWGVDLRRLITGEREDTLHRLGGVEEYVEVMLAEADDNASAEQAFNDALEQLVQTWQPSTLDSDFHISHILDLVSAYTPRGGFTKVISLVQALKRFKSDDEDAYSVDDDMYFKALVAFENYYPTAPKSPEDRSAAFRTYIDLLREDLGNPVYCGYALKRLVELRVMELGSEEVERLIDVNPASLKALLGLIIDPSRESKTEEELSLVYSLCLQAGSDAERHFEYAVIQCGGRMERRLEADPRIEFRGVIFVIGLTEVSRYRYWAMIFKRESERESAKGLERVEAMTAKA